MGPILPSNKAPSAASVILGIYSSVNGAVIHRCPSCPFCHIRRQSNALMATLFARAANIAHALAAGAETPTASRAALPQRPLRRPTRRGTRAGGTNLLHGHCYRVDAGFIIRRLT